MLAKAKRLTTKDFKGSKPKIAYRGAFFDISLSPGTETKFACIVSKKRIKRAVDRNLARRRIYTLLKDINLSTPSLVFVYPTKAMLRAPFASLKEELDTAFATL